MGTMMALRVHARDGPGQLVYEQAPAPSAGPGEVLMPCTPRRSPLRS
jgi:NADPH:quinone reductase-like Zn-dependent oxidoreductase